MKRTELKVATPVAKPAPKAVRRSTTSDILPGRRAKNGEAVHAPKIPAQWRAHYTALRGLRAHLLEDSGALARTAAEETPNFSMHMADSGTDSFDRDFALGLLSSKQDALVEVEAALRRIETGAYGRCDVTGKPIPRARLSAIPWTRFSLQAQRNLERAGALRTTHLGKIYSRPDGTSLETLEESEDDADSE